MFDHKLMRVEFLLNPLYLGNNGRSPILRGSGYMAPAINKVVEPKSNVLRNL